MNLSKFIDGILLPRAEIALDVQDAKGRIDLVLSLSSLIKNNLGLETVFALLKRLTFNNLAFTFADIPGTDLTSIGITFDEILVKRTKEQFISLQNGYIIVELNLNEASGGEIKDIINGITIRSLVVKVSDALLNEAVRQNRDMLLKKNISDLSISFLDGISAVKGKFHKITAINFSVNVSAQIKNKKLLIELSNMNVMNFGVPSLIKNKIIDFASYFAKLDFVTVEDNCILVDPYKIAGQKIDFDLKSIDFEKDFLVVELFKEEGGGE